MHWFQNGYSLVSNYLSPMFIEFLKSSIAKHNGNPDFAAKEIFPIWHTNKQITDLLKQMIPGAIFTPSQQIGVAIKYPGDPAHNWHSDWTGNGDQSGARPSRIGLFVYLQETTVENGCLKVFPNSHLSYYYDHKQEDSVSVPTNRGDVVVLDSRLLHGTNPHRGKEAREMVLCWYDVSEGTNG